MGFVDPDKFIAYSKGALEDPEQYQEFLLECRRRFQNFISGNPETIKERLWVKLEKGGQEHGNRHYDTETIQRELEDEFLDILGWSLVKQFNDH